MPRARVAHLLRCRSLSCLLLLPILGLAACGGKSTNVNTASYTCANFNKSLRTKGDDTSGQFINKLRKQAKLGQDKKTEGSEITLGIYFACRGKPGTTKPATVAIATSKKIKAGNFKLPPGLTGKKKSTK
jgi:hypothetical protein